MFPFRVSARARRRPALDRGLAAFRDCRSGVTAIEFAFAGPILFIAMLEILQGGMFLYNSAAIERATVAAARAIQVGNLTSQNASDAQNFRTQVLCPALMPGMACGNVVTNLQRANMDGAGYGAFVKPDLSGLVDVAMDNNQTSYCPSAPGAYQYLQVFYAMPLISPLWRSTVGRRWSGNDQTVVFVRAAAAFRNEPYTGTSFVSPGC
jgi:Flp pilus assembly protein TadG